MHTLRVGSEERLPAGLREAIAPVDFLAEEEEARIRGADLCDRGAAHEEACTHHEVHRSLRRVVEARSVERVQELRAGTELSEIEILGRETPQGREAAHRALQ